MKVQALKRLHAGIEEVSNEIDKFFRKNDPSKYNIDVEGDQVVVVFKQGHIPALDKADFLKLIRTVGKEDFIMYISVRGKSVVLTFHVETKE